MNDQHRPQRPRVGCGGTWGHGPRYGTQPAGRGIPQGRLGAAEAGALVERALARIAQGLVERGVRRLVVAGGETSGAVVQALGIRGLRIGPQIAPGVPWCAAALPDEDTLHITLKSGNFGGPDFFTDAFAFLDRETS
ncbi:nucleotide-binding domain containing protein [Streptomyces sparsogenes]|uniref:nucleotide-binding domain containing protein n=1 Tax=Streptomyces sparsogenes TaxID=67365 RepID=UPI003D9EDAC3